MLQRNGIRIAALLAALLWAVPAAVYAAQDVPIHISQETGKGLMFALMALTMATVINSARKQGKAEEGMDEKEDPGEAEQSETSLDKPESMP